MAVRDISIEVRLDCTEDGLLVGDVASNWRVLRRGTNSYSTTRADRRSDRRDSERFGRRRGPDSRVLNWRDD